MQRSLQKCVLTFVLVMSAFFIFLNGSARADNTDHLIIDTVKKLQLAKNVTLVVLYPQGSLPNIKPVAEAFTKRTGVKISFQQTTVDDINTKMLLAAAQDISDYDIALPATFGIPDLVEAGALYDLSDYAAKYEPLVNYQPSLYALGDSYKGKKYGYQTDGDTYVMFYNKSWLDSEEEKQRFKAKYNRPLSVPKSWKELDELMAFFHRPDEDKYGGCLFRTPRYMVWEWWIRFHAKGVCPVDDNMQSNIASEAGVTALEAMISATKYQHPSVTTNGLFENWKQYGRGNCFANIGWGGSQKYFNSSKSLVRGKMVHTPTPGVSYFNWGWNYVVSKHSKHPELAYLFTLFATTNGASTSAVRQDGFFDPFRMEHYTDDVIKRVYTTSFLKAHKKTMTNAIPDFYLEGQGRYVQALQEAIVSAHEGHVTAKEALGYAASQWNEITEDIGRQSQIEQWLQLKQKYPQTLMAR